MMGIMSPEARERRRQTMLRNRELNATKPRKASASYPKDRPITEEQLQVILNESTVKDLGNFRSPHYYLYTGSNPNSSNARLEYMEIEYSIVIPWSWQRTKEENHKLAVRIVKEHRKEIFADAFKRCMKQWPLTKVDKKNVKFKISCAEVDHTDMLRVEFVPIEWPKTTES